MRVGHRCATPAFRRRSSVSELILAIPGNAGASGAALGLLQVTACSSWIDGCCPVVTVRVASDRAELLDWTVGLRAADGRQVDRAEGAASLSAAPGGEESEHDDPRCRAEQRMAGCEHEAVATARAALDPGPRCTVSAVTKLGTTPD